MLDIYSAGVAGMLFTSIVTGFFLLFFPNGINAPVFLIAFAMPSYRFHTLVCGFMAPCNLFNSSAL